MALAAFGLTSCSDDPMDATSKHVYGANENPYLRTSTAATINCTANFVTGAVQPVKINIADYAAQIKANMGMTVDELFSNLESGKVVFHNINVARGAWDKTAPTKGTTGWYYTANGGVTTETDAAASVELDKGARQLIVNVPTGVTEAASLSANVGFALDNGKDYDTYVRFSIAITVATPQP